MNRYALSFTVTPGSESAVAEILRGYGRPRAAAADGGPPMLRRTSVFMAGRRVLRVVDVDGEIGEVMRHLAEQPQIRAAEAALDPHLATPRDLGSPQGRQAFLDEALLPAALHRVTPAELLPEVAADRRGQRCALLYPVRPGHGEAAAALLAAGPPLSVRASEHTALAATTVFRRGDLLVRMFEVDGELDEALDHLAAAAASSPVVAELAGAVATPQDLTTAAGFRGFLDDCRMELLTDRRVEVPA